MYWSSSALACTPRALLFFTHSAARSGVCAIHFARSACGSGVTDTGGFCLAPFSVMSLIAVWCRVTRSSPCRLVYSAPASRMACCTSGGSLAQVSLLMATPPENTTPMLTLVMYGATSYTLAGRMPVASDTTPSLTPVWMSV
jgi:hypothetical protein